MAKYLGQNVVKQEETQYKDYNRIDWVEYFLDSYGEIDGAHHKMWVINQCLRIIKGTPIIINLARWDDGQVEYRITTGEPSQEYLNYVKEVEDAGYEVNDGIPP